jgi:sugar lactone lactonase YvrE
MTAKPTFEITVVADFGDLCGECPVWDDVDQILYWVDLDGGRVFRHNPSSQQSIVLKNNFPVSGLRRNSGGGFAMINSLGAWLWDGEQRLQLLASEVAGAACRLNDCAADRVGRLITGSNFYTPAVEYPLGALFEFDTSGRGRILDEGFHQSNGIAFSPNAETMYFTDTIARTIYAYDYDLASGDVKNRKIFACVPSSEGLPDGLAVDAEGFVWSAQWYGGCVVRYDPDGQVERRVAVPAKQTSNLAFGGPDLTDIFITTAARPETMPLMPPGYDPDSGPFGGPLYKINLGIPGQPTLPTAIAWPAKGPS